jgi:hypothetical protein
MVTYIKNPETALVQKKQQGYFNYLHGIIHKTNINQAEKYFKKSN